MTKEVLAGIIDNHKRRLAHEGGQRADLRGAELSGADLSGADLQRADLSGADLRGADLQRADLSGADLQRADLSCADLSGANLGGADLIGADLNGANLQRADLRGSNVDFVGWPLSCGSLDVKADKRIAVQLLYHAVRAMQSVDDAECKRFCESEAVKNLANQFHRTESCGRIGDAKCARKQK